ncbi:hypothetical protein DFH27DRAFT_303254 [Peziza echinospora]|nr:hypothetical protein DFH27DRAFT_303254 [Peziza echinospora]
MSSVTSALVAFLGNTHLVLTSNSSYPTIRNVTPLSHLLKYFINLNPRDFQKHATPSTIHRLFDTYTRIYIPLKHDSTQDMPDARRDFKRKCRISKSHQKYSEQQAKQD